MPTNKTTPASGAERRIVSTAIRLARERRIRTRIAVWSGRIGFLTVLLLSWEIGSRSLGWGNIVSRPSEILEVFKDVDTRQVLFIAIGVTISEAALGLFFGALGGFVLAIFLFSFPKVYSVLEPLLLAFFSIPKIALAPLLIMWFGLGITPKILLASTLVFFLVLFNIHASLEETPKRLLAACRLLGGSEWQILQKVLLPTIRRSFLVSLRLALPTAITGALLGELISANQGIGYFISSSAAMGQAAYVFAGLLLLLALVLTMNAMLRWGGKLQLSKKHHE